MTDFAAGIEEPIDLVLLSLKEKVYVKCRYGRELKGKLVVSVHVI
jgi:small nuclear ribonucleoprotein (snRNP)-like protein